MAAEIIGLTVGGISLATAFRGTVDSFLLIKTFFDNEDDSGIHDLALHYHIQCQAFKNWGDRHNIHATNPEDCALTRESDHVKMIIAGVIERMRKLHEDGKKYLDIHDADLAIQHNALASPSKFMKRLDMDSQEVTTSSAQRAYKKHKNRIKWAIVNKIKFAEVVKQMKDYNKDLDDLLTETNKVSFGLTLPGRVLAPLDTPDELDSIRRLTDKSSFLLSHMARLKSLKISPDQNASLEHIYIPSSDILLEGALTERVRNQGNLLTAHSCEVGWYKTGQRIWIEWRVLDEGLSDAQTSMMINRVRTLGTMLSAESTSIIKTSQCIGILKDKDNSLRQGLVFQPPGPHDSAFPTTLLQIISESIKPSATRPQGWMSEPPLGHKFSLARNLASSLVLLHASKWLHKAFRSDNIIFFGDIKHHDAILDHHIAGFEHSRHLEGESYGHRPTGQGPVDYFYHPDVPNGFSKHMDLYSFGVVLLEIAFWRPLRTRIPAGKFGSLDEIRKVFLESARRVVPKSMGSIYANVVVRCLECNFPADDDEFVTAMNVFVISPLDRCCA